ncbi:MAG: hypothetical protein ACYCQJ_00850 [Nitrososphaerales archaeon]
MTSIRTTFAVIGVIIVILVGSAVGLTFLQGKATTTVNGITSNKSTTSVSTSESATTTSTTSKPTFFSLNVQNAGEMPALSTNFTAEQGYTPIQNDASSATYGPWTFNGDFEPGTAWFTSGKGGLDLSLNTCSPPDNHGTECGPYWEWNGQHEEFLVELSGTYYNLPSNVDLLSINVTIPFYSFMSSCASNYTKYNGCSYEGPYGPTDSAILSLLSSSPNSAAGVFVSVSESAGFNGNNSLAIGVGTSTFANGEYVNGTTLYSTTESFTPKHTLTIATDRKNFIEMFVDGREVYSSSTIPVSLNGSSIQAGLQMNTNINNETLSTIWSNFVAYSSNTISVSGLQSGMQVVVSGPGGFSANGTPSANGIANIDVANEPTSLLVAIEQNGKTIARANETVSVGASLNLVTS